MKIARLISLLSLMILSACGPETVEEVTVTYPEGESKTVVTYEVDGEEKVRIAQKELFPSGKVMMEGAFKDDFRTGVWQAWFENGTLQSQYNYEEGKRQGPCKVWYENGNLYYEGAWDNDEKVDVWNFYNEDGTLATTVDHSAQ